MTAKMKTKSPQHTPGPWTTEGIDGLSVHHSTGDKTYRFIALTDSEHDTGRTDTENRLEDEANARLIAAAPELLEAAKAALFAFGRGGANVLNGPNRKEWEMLQAAIARAEGKP